MMHRTTRKASRNGQYDQYWSELFLLGKLMRMISEYMILSTMENKLMVNEQASEEVLQIEQKYNEIRRPVYEKRNEVIKSIPDFWVTAFLSHPALGELLNVEDQKIFKYLDSLDVEDFKDVTSGYSLTFKFKPNPYFEDTKLVKTYTFLDEGSTKIIGTAIKWKEGMGAAYGGNPEMKGNKRPPSEESFFSWFSETQLKDISDGLSDEEADEEGSDGEEDDEEGSDDVDEEDEDDG
ncbi:NAP1-related protein 2 [Capsicum annuum]|nr:NAP1-related protein 2 [Capsicum annuum]